MNIFFLDRCPQKAATYLVDSHVVKMVVETAQLLSTTHRVLDGSKIDKHWILPDSRETLFYKATHLNHPCAIWARTSVENYSWLVEYFQALGREYTFRYEKKHKTIERLGYKIKEPPSMLKKYSWSEPYCAMPDEYRISSDFIVNYREYYRRDKQHLHKWKKRERPHWIDDWHTDNL